MKKQKASNTRTGARAIERDYFAAIMDRVDLETWGAIVDKAIQDAKAGDAKAREWVAKYALGANPLTLTDLATREALGVESGHEIAGRVANIQDPQGDAKLLQRLSSGPSDFDRALAFASDDASGA